MFLFSPQILGLGKMPIYFVVNARLRGAGVDPRDRDRCRWWRRGSGRAGLAALLAVFGLILGGDAVRSRAPAHVGTHIAEPTTVSSARAWGIAVGVAIRGRGARMAIRSRAGARSADRGLALARARCLRWSWSVAICSRSRTSRIAINTILRWRGSAIGCWCCTTSGSRSVGFFTQYPLYGADLSNYVQYVARPVGRQTFVAHSRLRRMAPRDQRRTIRLRGRDQSRLPVPGEGTRASKWPGPDPIPRRSCWPTRTSTARGHGCSRSTASCIPAAVRPHPLPARSGQ